MNLFTLWCRSDELSLLLVDPDFDELVACIPNVKGFVFRVQLFAMNSV